jgi:hypothetical protein
MIQRLIPSVLVLLAATALAAGCGSSSSSSSATTSGSTGSSSTATTGAAKAPGVSAAVAQCKRGVNVLPTLSTTTKHRLESICDKAASGNAKAVHDASREACEEIVKASPLPPGSARNRALAGCKSAGKELK